MEKEYELLIGQIYTEVDDGRHGLELDRRVGCVLALVGMVIWIDDGLQLPAVRWLGRKIEAHLHQDRALAA